MKKTLFIITLLALLEITTAANAYSIHNGSIVQFTNEYVTVNTPNPSPVTFYGTTIETSPNYWELVCNSGGMWFLGGMAMIPGVGVAPWVTDYMGVSDDLVWSPDRREPTQAATPIPAPLALLGTGLLGMVGFRRCSKNRSQYLEVGT